MATSEVGLNEAADTSGSLNISPNKVLYRQYGAFDEKGKARGVDGKNPDGSLIYSGKPAFSAETNTRDNWTKQETNGATVLTENQLVRYTLNNIAGFFDLIPDEKQQLYVMQRGIDTLQNAAAASIMQELEKKTLDENGTERDRTKDDPDEFVYNGDTVDLRPYINTPPQKGKLTVEEKFNRAIEDLSVLDPAKAMAALEALRLRIQGKLAAEN